MASTTAARVARYILWQSERHGWALSNLELLKILYYAQGWFLALYENPLFGDDIEAWSNGPVVASVYGNYKHSRWMPIEGQIEDPQLSAPINDHLNVVLNTFGNRGAEVLRRITHSEAPWLVTREGLAPNSSSRRVIPMDRLKTYFMGLLHGGRVDPRYEWAKEALLKRAEEEHRKFTANLHWVNSQYGDTLKRLSQQ